MDTVKRYQQIIHHLLEEYRAWYADPADTHVETGILCDDDHGEYLLMQVGWHGETRVRRSLFYLRLRNAQIWIEEDWTQDGIASALTDAGVPPGDIILAFNPPEV